jgi:hypothetical protein
MITTLVFIAGVVIGLLVGANNPALIKKSAASVEAKAVEVKAKI